MSSGIPRYRFSEFDRCIIDDYQNGDIVDFEEYQKLEHKLSLQSKIIEELKAALSTCKNDYWFMENLIERYSSNKDQTLKDCLERMKFRKAIFNVLTKVQEPEKEMEK